MNAAPGIGAMIIERSFVEDAAEILALQKIAYLSEADIYGDYSLPPLTQTMEQMQDDFRRQLVLKAVVDNRIVGSVRASAQEQTCHIGRLIVHPEFRNRGLGSLLMQEIEKCFKQAARFELFTGHLSEGNLRLYRSLGYDSFDERQVTDGLRLVFLEKANPAAQ